MFGLSAENVVPTNFVGASVGGSSFTDNGLNELFKSPFSWEVDVISFENTFGFGVNVWGITADTDYGVGTITQTGVGGDLLPNAKMPLGTTSSLILYGGGGVGYQTTKLEANWDGSSAENEGISVNWLVGSQFSIGKIGLFVQYKEIYSEAGSLDVGSGGLKFGLRYGVSI